MTLFYFASFFFTKDGSVETLYFSFKKQSIQDYLPQEAKKPLITLNIFCFLFQSKGAEDHPRTLGLPAPSGLNFRTNVPAWQ